MVTQTDTPDLTDFHTFLIIVIIGLIDSNCTIHYIELITKFVLMAESQMGNLGRDEPQ